MSWLRLLNWLNRQKITLLVASFTLTLGAISTWYRLPPESLESFGTSLSFINTVRIVVAVFALMGFAFTLWFQMTLAPRLLFWSGLIAVLLFPYFITTWSPTAAFLSKAYYDQQERVTDHAEKNFSAVQAQWKQNILLDRSRPIRSISDFSIKDSRFFQFSSWDQFLMEGFGYSNDFFGAIGRGWGLTLTGLVISLIALYLEWEDEKFNVFLRDIGKLLPWVGLVMTILVFSLVLPNIINHQLDTMLAQGEYHQLLATSRTLESWYPPLSGDEAFLKRMAQAAFYGHEPDLALISFAQGVERFRLGDFRKATNYFQQSLASQPRQFLVKGYLASAIANQGVSYFNSCKPGAAADYFEQALRIYPGHIEALYDLMLARVVNGEFDKSALAAQEIIEIQKYSQQPSLTLLGQAYLHSAWAKYQNGDLTQAWKRYRQSIDKSTWKQPVNDEAQ